MGAFILMYVWGGQNFRQILREPLIQPLAPSFPSGSSCTTQPCWLLFQDVPGHCSAGFPGLLSLPGAENAQGCTCHRHQLPGGSGPGFFLQLHSTSETPPSIQARVPSAPPQQEVSASCLIQPALNCLHGHSKFPDFCRHTQLTPPRALPDNQRDGLGAHAAVRTTLGPRHTSVLNFQVVVPLLCSPSPKRKTNTTTRRKENLKLPSL